RARRRVEQPPGAGRNARGHRRAVAGPLEIPHRKLRRGSRRVRAAMLGHAAMTRLRSPAASASFGEARRPASAKAAAVRRSFSEGGSASGAEAAASPKDERRATLFGSPSDERRATLSASPRDERRATLSASPKPAGEPERLALHGEPKNECRATLSGSPNRPLRIAIIAPYDLSA